MNRLIDPPGIRFAVQRMVCTSCGSEANASCTCGVSYAPKSARAAEAIAKNPEKSDRAIADEIGVSQPTVSRARKRTDTDVSVPRTGKDGKTRKMPQPRIDTTHPPADLDAQAGRLITKIVEVMRPMTPAQRDDFRQTVGLHMRDAYLDDDVVEF
jgi:hypothetical protein